MSINSSAPILQIKTSGYNLENIKSINISVDYQKGTIQKDNDSIEIDNDIVNVALTNEESSRLGDGNEGIGVSIRAKNMEDMDISENIKINWIKKGSMASPSGGDFVSNEEFNSKMTNIDIGIDDLENSLTIGNSRVYLDYKDGKYGVNTDPERGADTFVPFKENEESTVDSPLVIPFSFTGQYSYYNKGYNLDVRSFLPSQIQGMVKRIKIKELTAKRSNLIAGKASGYFYFRIYGKKMGETKESYPYTQGFVTSQNSTSVITTKFENIEVDISGYEFITSFGIYAAVMTTSNYRQYDFKGTMEVYF